MQETVPKTEVSAALLLRTPPRFKFAKTEQPYSQVRTSNFSPGEVVLVIVLEVIHHLCLIFIIMLYKSCREYNRTIILQVHLHTYYNNYIYHDSITVSNLLVFIFYFIFFSKFQCNQSISVPDFGWRVNHVKSYYHRVYKICYLNFGFFLVVVVGGGVVGGGCSPAASLHPFQYVPSSS